MSNSDPATVRKWASENGLVIANRGRLPQAVVDAYAAAHDDARPDQPSPRNRSPRRRPAGSVRASPASGAAGEDPVYERLRAVEAQLALAIARIDTLEERTTRSVLGLRLSL